MILVTFVEVRRSNGRKISIFKFVCRMNFKKPNYSVNYYTAVMTKIKRKNGSNKHLNNTKLYFIAFLRTEMTSDLSN